MNTEEKLSLKQKTKIKLSESKIPLLDRAVFNICKFYPLKLEGNVYRFNIENRRSRYWFSELIQNVHEKEVSLALLDHLEKDDFFVDLGAHVGYFSVLANKTTDKNVLAIEMNPTIIQDILNQDESIDILCAAITGGRGEINSFGSEGGPACNNVKGESNISVATTDLEDVFSKYNKPDFIKVDIEGSESTVIPRLLESTHPPKMILEIHPQRLKNEELRKIEKHLFDSYNQIKYIEASPKGYKTTAVEELDQKEENFSILCK